ncbi:MAG: SlyX family protein [Sphaerochaetaceae bacterium]|nr:SlyX family protein [Sphaerochaetaceae bacterium]MDC7238479.1 SlyX family protein [Sphaerochaetaceae bacterium]MDC7248336.1 SlyX family protein [Sphaerochaetaceae bacterium]
MSEKRIEESIEKIEIKLSYAEEMVAQLNEIIINQQKEIGIMNNHINKLERKVAQLIEDNESSDLPNRKPPHY